MFVVEVGASRFRMTGERAFHSGTQTYRLGILRDANGSGGSLHVHDVLQAGDIVRIRGPRNNFPLVTSKKYIFIAGGIGITPMLPMIRTAIAAGAGWELTYGGRQRSSMAFLGELAAYGDRVTVWPQEEKGFIDLKRSRRSRQPGRVGRCMSSASSRSHSPSRCVRRRSTFTWRRVRSP